MQVSGTSATQKQWLLESLYGMPLEQIRVLGTPGSYAATVSAMSTAKTSTKLLGDAQNDLVFRPIQPCRFIDTRNIGGPISGSRDYDLDNTGTTYGGVGACDPKASAGGNADNIGGIAINLTIVGPTVSPGFMGARPFGSTNTTSMVNWYQTGPTVQAANASVVMTDQSGATDEIEFFGSPTDIVVDIFGVFTAPAPTALDCTAVTLVSPSIPTGQRTFAQPTCAAGYTVTGGGVAAATNDNQIIEASEARSNGWFTSVLNNSGGSRIFTFSATCCRVPGR